MKRKMKRVSIMSEYKPLYTVLCWGCLQAHWSCGCNSSAVPFSPEDKTGSSCGNQTPFLPWSLLRNLKEVYNKQNLKKKFWIAFIVFLSNLQRCVQNHWSPSCCCSESRDQTTSSSGHKGSLAQTHRHLRYRRTEKTSEDCDDKACMHIIYTDSLS